MNCLKLCRGFWSTLVFYFHPALRVDTFSSLVHVKEQVDWFSTMSSLLTPHIRDVVGQIPGLITDRTMILSCWRFTHDVCVSLLALVTHTAMRKYTRLTLFTEVHYIKCQATQRSWKWVKKNVVFKRIAKRTWNTVVSPSRTCSTLKYIFAVSSPYSENGRRVSD